MANVLYDNDVTWFRDVVPTVIIDEIKIVQLKEMFVQITMFLM